jgi:transposase
MPNVIIAVDLAKDVFEVAISASTGRITERRRLSRLQFERFWCEREPCRVVMEACASAHFWARRLLGLGYEVTLLPAQYVRPYVRRNKTDRTDCEALLDCAELRPVSVKSQDQQAILALHRARSQWMRTRTARINGMRGLLREFGVVSPRGPPTCSAARMSCSIATASASRSAYGGWCSSTPRRSRTSRPGSRRSKRSSPTSPARTRSSAPSSRCPGSGC